MHEISGSDIAYKCSLHVLRQQTPMPTPDTSSGYDGALPGAEEKIQPFVLIEVSLGRPLIPEIITPHISRLL